MSLLPTDFPNLSSDNFVPTSPETSDYNCIAWAAGEDDRWWWPGPAELGGYWPPGVSRAVVSTSFLDAFRTLGYEKCTSGDLEPNFEKLALYANQAGVPTHMARQLPDGNWTSKLGRNIDICHFTLDAIANGTYGVVQAFYWRPISQPELL